MKSYPSVRSLELLQGGSAQDAFFKTSVLEMCVMSGKHWLLSLGGGKKKAKHPHCSPKGSLSVTGSLVAFETVTKPAAPPPPRPIPPPLSIFDECNWDLVPWKLKSRPVSVMYNFMQ